MRHTFLIPFFLLVFCCAPVILLRAQISCDGPGAVKDTFETEIGLNIVTFAGYELVNDPNGCQTCFYYCIQSQDRRAVSHVTFGSSDCDETCLNDSENVTGGSWEELGGNIVRYDDASLAWGYDPSSGFCGLKFDEGFSQSNNYFQQFYICLQGDLTAYAGAVDVLLKTGSCNNEDANQNNDCPVLDDITAPLLCASALEVTCPTESTGETYICPDDIPDPEITFANFGGSFTGTAECNAKLLATNTIDCQINTLTRDILVYNDKDLDDEVDPGEEIAGCPQTFGITPPELEFFYPEPVYIEKCESQEALDDAFNEFLSGFDYDEGCPPYAITGPTWPAGTGPDCLGSTTTVTYSVESACRYMTTTVDFVVAEPLLPVELLGFQAVVESGRVTLAWTTTTESNNDYFAVERSADGGRTFTEIVRVKGAGTTQQKQSYYHIDSRPLPATSYYRLRQVDFDGAMRYHGPLAVQSHGRAPLRLSPNPVTDFLTLDLPADPQGELTATIFDALGREVLRTRLNAPGLQQRVDVQELRPATYLLRLQDGDAAPETRMFIRQ